jgi:1,4-alpha-glucan branching enzyme
MKTAIVGVALLAALPASAQTNEPVVEDFKPSTLNQPGQDYPQVNSQRYARFRIVAPQAQSVTVGLGGRGGTPLTKGEDGVWMGTTAKPMEEGFHYYHLTIDGGGGHSTIPAPGTFTVRRVGKAASKSPLMIRTSTLSKTFPTAECS